MGRKYFIALVSLLFIAFSSAVLAERDEDNYNTITSVNKQCEANILPSYINSSMIWEWYGESGEKSIYRIFQKLSPPSIIVTAAGNSAPESVSPVKVKASKDFDAIIVGSMTPDGQHSSFSQQSEEVHILAPSDYLQVSADNSGTTKWMGWTSGATPMVTGGLSGFDWLSGYHPTAKEAKILLEKTAIPTRYSNDKPRENGVGMLNSYKLGMVGKRLKEICGYNQSCIKKMIQNPSLYNFPTDKGLPQALKGIFPECDVDACSNKSSNEGVCRNKEAVFKRLRKAVLLDSSNGELWRYLSCIYKSNGFHENAKGAIEFYKNSVAPHGVAYCKEDTDCTLIPSCSRFVKSSLPPLQAVTKQEAEIFYIFGEPSCNKSCNGKCRCGNKETVTPSFPDKKHPVIYNSQCVNSRCVVVKGKTEGSNTSSSSSGSE